MKKIPTLFVREFEGHNIVNIQPELSSPELAEVLAKGTPTIKWDGSCVLYKDGVLYRRYDAKRGKTPPPNALPCQPEPDPVTGHWPHWIECDPADPDSKHYTNAFRDLLSTYGFHGTDIPEGTYEAVGPHFQRNPYKLQTDTLLKHGDAEIIDLTDRTFEGVKAWLTNHEEEGIVFWYKGEPRCKIKRSDFGLPWNVKK